MMKVQLLLLLALVGPFCVFTRASPTELPKELDDVITAAGTGVATEAPGTTELPEAEVLTVVTGGPTTEPPAAPEEVATEVHTHAPVPSEIVTQEAAGETEAAVPATTEAPARPTTDKPPVESEAPTDGRDVTVKPTSAAKVEEDVVVEDEGLSSGQVVGIVIGSLLAVIIVIAVVIAVVRRMGKYSP